MKKQAALLLTALLLFTAGCGTGEPQPDPDHPVTLTLWHVYGEQADSPMNRLVAEFNETVGLEQGIVVDVTLVSNAAEIGSRLLDAQANAPGVPDFPDLFFCHTGNAAALGPEQLLDWNSCFSADELANYVPGFLSEGQLDGRQLVFPVSKSTHLLFLNGTRFARFSDDTGVTAADLATWDGFYRAAEQYYDWSGGKAFCALDYPLRAAELCALSQGREVPMEGSWYDFSNDALHQAWLPFARSLVQGHVLLSDLFANTQVMTGEALSGLGSSAAILYYNDVVTYPDNTTEPMNLMVLPMPACGNPMVTQAGVGLCARAASDEKARAASTFAHWFTEPERNLEFVAKTGYMPVHNGSFQAIDHYDFSDQAHARLYETLQSIRETSTAVTEPSQPGYFGHVNQLYAELRQLQPQLQARYQAGEDPELLAEETWQLVLAAEQ